ncbi:uncharacterized protein LOC127012500 [Drosophila biarmipes]|uniref:uncharacterized protein LOC127012500 n=1 Tax=Drosophila biarmipes TaxID=125945 RepID=UPI0007E7745F|nr:uncharacterized protein LOC127012500 [Drosophila biarmipes]
MVVSSIDSLLTDQLKLGERIQSIIRNYKKDSAKRKSKPGYYKERLTKLELLGDTFFAGERQIQNTIRGMEIEHKYFKNNFFTITKNVLDDTKAEFAKHLNLLEKETSPGVPVEEEDIKRKLISPTKEDVKLDIKLESNPAIKRDIKSMFREQKVLMDRLDIIINKMTAETRLGLNPVALPYLSEMKSMHMQIYNNFRDSQ